MDIFESILESIFSIEQAGLVILIFFLTCAPVYMDYGEEKDRILTVASTLRSMNLINDEDTILFTATFRTILKHASNLIEIHNIKELRERARSRVDFC